MDKVTMRKLNRISDILDGIRHEGCDIEVRLKGETVTITKEKRREYGFVCEEPDRK